MVIFLSRLDSSQWNDITGRESESFQKVLKYRLKI